MTSPPAPLRELVVVTHTHWDREWYLTREEFRPALVALVDEVLDAKDTRPFLLDGQAVILTDYLENRPASEQHLRLALASGRLEAGPWFVLGDNLIPGGEALVRNLLTGRAVVRRLGGVPPAVLYCPDSFGHPACLPLLAAGFGFGVAVVWRGYGGEPWPPGDTVRHRAIDGSEVLLHHLAPDGYELGANLPSDRGDAARRWSALRAVLEPRATLGLAFLPNGADHHAVQANLGQALAALAVAAAPVQVSVASLGEFGDRLALRASGAALPVVQGELRHSPNYVWALQGTFGSRAPQKRANARAERLLVHGVETQTALAWWNDGVARRHEVHWLWRTLLACHPHDTLCGCSTDAVAMAMDERLREVMRGGMQVLSRARRARLGHDADAARDRRDQWQPRVVAWNSLPRARGGICELEVDEPVAFVPVGPGSAGAELPPAAKESWHIGHPPLVVQELSRELRHTRELSPRHYPVNELVQRRRLLAWVPPVPALGALVLPLVRGKGPRADGGLPERVRTTRDTVENAHCRVWVSEHRTLCIATADGRELHDVLGIEAVGERGDLYTHSPIPGTMARGGIVWHRLTRRGPLRGELRLTMQVVVPARELTSATGSAIHHRASPVTFFVDVQLDAGASVVRFVVHGPPPAEVRDARVRLLVRTGVPSREVWADAAFGEVRREVPVGAPAAGRAREVPPTTAPLHRYVSRYSETHGVTLISDGLAEYEAAPEGDIAVTLLRAVGELSRGDLPERPGHAGWPVSTPGAQGAGAPGGAFALFVHGPRSEPTIAAIADAADVELLPLVGETWRSALAPIASKEGATLEGEGLVLSACKEAEAGGWLVLRCRNVLARPVAGSWQLQGAAEACLARLDETPLGALTVQDGRVTFSAPAFGVVTILVRPGDHPHVGA